MAWEHESADHEIDMETLAESYTDENAGYPMGGSMVYPIEAIRESQEIFAYLLEHRELSMESPEEGRELYQAYTASEEVRALVRSQAEALHATVEEYRSMVYLIPDMGNTFLGFTKAELKRRLCRAGATEVDFYLVQFVILVLLVEFYDGESAASARTRTFLRVGDLQNDISEYLRTGASRYSPEEQEQEGIDFQQMMNVYESLRSYDEGNRRSKTTKEGFVYTILKFLEDQHLVNYIEQDEQIYATTKLDLFMDNNLLNREHFDRVQEVLSDLDDAADSKERNSMDEHPSGEETT